MASKKMSSIEQAALEPEVKPNDPWEKVRIKLPRDKNDGKGLYVNVNDYNYWIPRGEIVEVPRFIAAVISNSIDQDEATAYKIDKLSEKADF